MAYTSVSTAVAAIASLGIVAGIETAAANSDCPAYLDHEFRKLRSKESVNLCTAFAGKPMLIVNTASHCGFTPQFEGLEALHKEYAGKGLVVVGFPSNDFRQEAASEDKTAEICFANYGITFEMMSPVSVRGAAAHPLFVELARQSDAPQWNFNKYVVDRSGNVVEHFGSFTGPDSAQIRKAIERVL